VLLDTEDKAAVLDPNDEPDGLGNAGGDPPGDKQDPPADKGGAKPKESPEIKALRRQLADRDRQVQELSEAERYWADQAKGAGKGKGKSADNGENGEDVDPGAVPSDAGGELEDADSFIDALTKKGPKHLEGTMRKLGFVPAADVAKIAAKTAREIVSSDLNRRGADAELATKYPDLKDESSELFKATRQELVRMVRLDPRMETSPAAILTAAELAHTKLAMKAGTPNQERERRARIDEQFGDLGRSHNDDGGDGEDETLGPEALAVIGAMNIKPEDYRASRKQLDIGRRR